MIYDYGFAFTQGSVTVNAGLSLNLLELTNTPPNTKMSLVGGGIQIADTGWYHVSWGFTTNSVSATNARLRVDGATTVQQSPALISAALLCSMSAIVQITSNPGTLTLTNNSGGTRTYVAADATAPAFYMTVIKLQ